MQRARSTTVVASPAAAAETAVCTVGPLSLETGDPVDIIGLLDITIGTSGTSVTARLRRGSDTSGTAIATLGPANTTAASRYLLPIAYSDTQPDEYYGLQYTLTVTVAAATAQSTVNSVYLVALY